MQEVTFCAQLPGNITRSFGEGTKVNELKAFVYDKNFKYVTQANGTMEGANGVVTIPLAKGIDYKVVFWAGTSGKTTYTEQAAADGASTPYEISWTSGEMKVNYAAMTANDDANDAFSYTLDFKGGNPAPSTPISLTRPFAQVNFGTDDLTKNAVISAYKGQVYTQVRFKAATSMNLVNRSVAAPSETYYSNGIALIPAQTEAFPVTGYNYTNMIYMLAPEGSTALSDMEFSVYTAAAEGNKLHSFNVSAAPVQANYRTNVYGSLLTSTTDFNVQIAPGFTDDNNIQLVEYKVSTTAELVSALQESNKSEFSNIKVTENINLPAENLITVTNTNTHIELEEGVTLAIGGVNATTRSQIECHPEYSIQIAPGSTLTISGLGTIKDMGRMIKNSGTLIIEDGNFICEGTIKTLLWNLGELTINGGHFEGPARVVYNDASSKFTMNGGTIFSNDNIDYALISDFPSVTTNIHDGEIKGQFGGANLIGTVNITGGKFYVPASESDEIYYPLFLSYATGTISGGSFYACSQTGTACLLGGGCNVSFEGGKFSAPLGTDTFAPAAGFEWNEINEPALPGTNPLVRQITPIAAPNRKR